MNLIVIIKFTRSFFLKFLQPVTELQKIKVAYLVDARLKVMEFTLS